VGLIAGGREALTLSVEGAEDDPEAGADELEGIELQPDDSVVGITASGRAPYVIGGLKYARSIGALTVALSCNRDSAVSRIAEIAITPVVGPEILSGSTRLKAGTATKLVLNTLSTGVFVRLGKTYGNLMVDLRATNGKLIRRSQRIVSLVTGLTAAEARRHLDRCAGEVKTCIVAAKRNVDPETARKLLRETGGRLRPALE
jgi:N-acetylmuramic acid 6-phosphate etherase